MYMYPQGQQPQGMQRPMPGGQGLKPMPMGGLNTQPMPQNNNYQVMQMLGQALGARPTGGQNIDPGFNGGAMQMPQRPAPIQGPQGYRGNPINSYQQVNRPDSIRGQAQTAYNQMHPGQAPQGQSGQAQGLNPQAMWQALGQQPSQGFNWGQALANYKR